MEKVRIEIIAPPGAGKVALGFIVTDALQKLGFDCRFNQADVPSCAEMKDIPGFSEKISVEVSTVQEARPF